MTPNCSSRVDRFTALVGASPPKSLVLDNLRLPFRAHFPLSGPVPSPDGLSGSLSASFPASDLRFLFPCRPFARSTCLDARLRIAAAVLRAAASPGLSSLRGAHVPPWSSGAAFGSPLESSVMVTGPCWALEPRATPRAALYTSNLGFFLPQTARAAETSDSPAALLRSPMPRSPSGNLAGALSWKGPSVSGRPPVSSLEPPAEVLRDGRL